MNKLKILLCILMSLLTVLFAISCSGYIDIKFSSNQEWIEGKPFPIRVTLSKTENVNEFKLFYSFNNNETKMVELQPTGKDYTYTIPGDEVIAGSLRYYVSFKYGDKQKLKRSEEVYVTILTIEEAIAKFEQELYERLSHTPPKQVPVNRDLTLSLNVKSPKSSTEVTFYYKKSNQNNYKSKDIYSSSPGEYKAELSSYELEQGYNMYYFEVSEKHPDVGLLQAYLPSSGENSPFKFEILSLDDLRDIMKKELYNSIRHTPANEVYEIFDHEIELSVNYEKGSYISQFSKNSLSVKIYYGESSNVNSFKNKTMSEQKNKTFTSEISSSELRRGYNAYYFVVSEQTEDVGEIETRYKSKSDLFQYRIITKDETIAEMEKELYKSIAHTPVEYATEVEDLELSISIEYSDKRTPLLSELSRNEVEIELYYGEKGNYSSFKNVDMNNVSDNMFTYEISKDEIKNGYNCYFFNISDRANKVGRINIVYPENGEQKPFVFEVLTVQEIREEYKNKLYERISHEPLKQAYGTQNETVKVTVKYATDKTSARLYIKKPRQTQYISRNMSRDHDTFEAEITAEEQRNNYTNYYFVVSEEYGSEIGKISVDYRENGEQNPFVYQLKEDTEYKNQLIKNLLNRIRHTPPTEVEEMNPLTLTLDVKDAVDGTIVTLYHKKPNANSYNIVTATQNNDSFSAEISENHLKQGHNQYYFGINEPNEIFEFISVTKPGRGADNPYQFNILSEEEKIYNNITFQNLPDIDYGDSVNASIRLNYAPQDTQVLLNYRLVGDTIDYHSLEMIKNNNIYEIAMSQALLQVGQIQYYFTIINESRDIEFTYPKQIPLAFNVIAQDTDSGGNNGNNGNNQDDNEEEEEESVFGDEEQTEENMLEVKIYQLEPNTSSLPDDFDDYEVLKTLYTRKIDIPARSFTEGFPGLENVFEWFAVQYTGTIKITESGKYKFKLKSDDGSKLWIGDELVVDNDGLHSPRAKNGKIDLTPGEYSFRLDYFQGPRTQIALQLFAKKPNEGEKLFDLADYE